MQGLLKIAGVPFVGAGVLGSAIGMDKEVTKRLLRDAGIPICNFLAFRKNDRIILDEIIQKLGLPLFVKPANCGSSVGVTKVKIKDALDEAIKTAFKYDTKILIEEFVRGREIECSVLGCESPQVSVPGEIIPQHEFYSYEAKYLDENGALLRVPAELSPDLVDKIKTLATQVYKILSCEGMARVDFFLKNNREIFVNEINTIPGFTSISMYPRLWQASGIDYSDLIDRLIELAFQRFDKEQKLKTTFL